MKTSSDFRQSAREALSGKWGLAIITGIVASLLGGVSNSGGTSFNFDFSGLGSSDIEDPEVIVPSDGDISSFEEAFESIFSEVDPSFWAIFGTVMAVGLVIGLIFGIAFFVLGSIVGVGYAKFNLNLIDGENADIGNLFSYFKHWKSTVLANLLRELYIFLWTLLCVIPGIIASFSYAMVPYIMSDNPELSPTEACARSKQMMDGHRMDLFILRLSFIGWSILCAFTCGIGYIVLTPYMEAAVADFYREISGTRPVPEIDPEIPVYIPEA